MLSMGALFQALQSNPSPATGLLFMVSSLVMLVAALQAARILLVVNGPGRFMAVIREYGAGRRQSR